MIRKSKQILGMSWFCMLFAGLLFGQTGDISSRLARSLTAVALYEYGGSREPLSEINEIIKTAVKSPEIGEQVEKQFIEFLKSNATLAGKQFICRKLSIIGTKGAVTVLSRMLDVDETFDMALYALEKNPSSNVDKILLKAMQKADGKQKIGLISTLGIRRYRPSVDALQKLVFDQDHEIAVAAIRSLSQIGTDDASHALFVAIQKTSGYIRTEVMNGYLQCADLMVKEGKIDEAIEAFKAFMVHVAKEEGTLMYTLNRDKSDPNTIIFMERYKDQAAFDAHSSTPHMKEFFAKSAEFIEGRPEMTLMEEIHSV